MTVLVVDDTALLLLDYTEHVRDLGHNVLSANSGHEAWRLLSDRSNGICAIITDVSMQHGNGCELVETLVANRRRLPILLHSAHGRHLDTERSLDLTPWANMMMVGYGAEISFHLKVGGPEDPETYIRNFLERHLPPRAQRAHLLAAE